MSVPVVACLQGEDPIKLLVAYDMHVFGVLANYTYQARTEIRYLFDAFVRAMISPAQLLNLAARFGPDVVEAASKLSSVCLLAERKSLPLQRLWTIDETLELIAKLVKGSLVNADPKRFVPYRTVDSWTKRLKRVVAELRAAGALTDERRPVLSFQHLDETNIEPCTRFEQDHIERDEKSLKIKYLALSKSLAMLKRSSASEKARNCKIIQGLKRKIENTAANLADNDEENVEHPNVFNQLSVEFHELIRIPAKGRRYSELVYNFAELLRTTSRKSYRIIRQIFPIPAESSLYSKFTDSIQDHKDELTKRALLRQRIEKVISDDGCTDSPITIGIDAFSFQTFSGETMSGTATREQFSNAFLFLHIPLDPAKPPRVIHLQKKANGSYDQSIADTWQLIKQIYSDLEIPVWYKATDGDRFLSQEHDKFFKENVEHYRNDFNLLLELLPDKLKEGVTMPISDPLHFAKNLRGKLIDHDVAVAYNDGDVALVNGNSLQEVLKLGPVLDDHTTLGRMRDVYVTKLFTLENVCTLIGHGDFAGALILLPYACIFTVLYTDNLANESRMFLTKLAFLVCNMLLDESQKIVANTKSIRHRYTFKCTAVTVSEPTYLKRVMHTCLALGISIYCGPTNVRLDAIGTHLVENSIGIARSISNSTKFEKIVSSFATTELRKDIAREYGLTLYVHKRINDGGAKINTMADDGIKFPDWDANDIASSFIESLYTSLAGCAKQDVCSFISQLRVLIGDLQIRKLSDTSEVANSLIVQRNFAFNREQRQTEQSDGSCAQEV